MKHAAKSTSHTPKEKRMASHIKASEKASGKSPKRSEEIAWTTVNKNRKSTGASKKSRAH